MAVYGRRMAPIDSRTEAPPPGAVARAVAEIARVAGITQQAISDETGTPLRTIQRRLSGKSPLPLTDLYGIARLLGRDPAELIGTAQRNVREAA